MAHILSQAKFSMYFQKMANNRNRLQEGERLANRAGLLLQAQRKLPAALHGAPLSGLPLRFTEALL
ncbi:MAG: hypothetical protein CDV28_1222 [Candidatus Electronema aureum]|uniref:Uncharacterized protein n=1 Tax=Candidatus Electronema aureum TaxID=2005002 RepID=A0A521G0N5_9BACT|nr:MAG: hypothetical protein CDV28_1222 [Candidatus Electronema aureum]